MAQLIIQGRTIEDVNAIFFDKDGTLITHDHFKAVMRKRAEIICRNIRDFDDSRKDELIRIMGVQPDTDVIIPDGLVFAPRSEVKKAVLTAMADWEIERSRAEQVVQEAFTRADHELDFREIITLIPGVRDMLASLREHGIKVVVASNDLEGRVRDFVQAQQLSLFVDEVLGGDSVKQGKPAPDMIFAGCERLGISPDTIIMVGDSLFDIETGKNANVALTIGVPSEQVPKEVLRQHADVVLNSVTELVACLPQND